MTHTPVIATRPSKITASSDLAVRYEVPGFLCGPLTSPLRTYLPMYIVYRLLQALEETPGFVVGRLAIWLAPRVTDEETRYTILLAKSSILCKLQFFMDQSSAYSDTAVQPK